MKIPDLLKNIDFPLYRQMISEEHGFPDIIYRSLYEVVFKENNGLSMYVVQITTTNYSSMASICSFKPDQDRKFIDPDNLDFTLGLKGYKSNEENFNSALDKAKEIIDGMYRK